MAILRKFAVVAMACSFFITDTSAGDPITWPGFGPEAIQAARERRAARELKRAQPAPRRAEPVQEELQPTRDSLLAYLRNNRWPKPEEVLPLGAPALEILLDILADEKLSPRYQEPAIGLLVPFGLKNYKPFDYSMRTRRAWLRPPVDMRGLTDDAARISNAILDYCTQHPDISPGDISSIIPLDRLPVLLEMAEKTNGMAQVAYISSFQSLTFTEFYTYRALIGGCGHDSYASLDQTAKADKDSRAGAPRKMREWWNGHRNKDPSEWAVMAIEAHIEKKRASLEAYPEQAMTNRSGLVNVDQSAAFRIAVGPSLYPWVTARYARADELAKPFLLMLIANTQHADAAGFVAKQLDTEDLALKEASVRGLGVVGRMEDVDAIRHVLQTAKEAHDIEEAWLTLHSILGSAAIPDLVAVTDDDHRGFGFVIQHLLDEYLPAHAVEIRNVADKIANPELAQDLRDRVERSTRKEEPPKTMPALPARAEQLARAESMLESGQSESMTEAIHLIHKDDLIELMPIVIGFLSSDDDAIREAAAFAIGELGVPDLTVENAPRLMGYSMQLDRKIAGYCYAKYGSVALPLVSRAVLSYPVDPEPRTRKGPTPPMGLIQVLVENKVDGIIDRVIDMALSKHQRINRFAHLLGQLDDPKSALLIGEFLRAGDPRSLAIRLARQRSLTQYGDSLNQGLLVPWDYDMVRKAAEDQQAERIEYQEYNRIAGAYRNQPVDAITAAMALVEFKDTRAWQAVHHVLTREYCDWKQLSGMSGVSGKLKDLSCVLSAHLADHRSAVREMLKRELNGEKRYWIISTLTMALCLDPNEADGDVLLAVATSAVATPTDRTLAAIALANVDDLRAIPVLRELVRSALEDSCRDASAVGGVWFYRPPRYSRIPRESEMNLTNDRLRQEYPIGYYERHQVSLGEALKRLGDDSLVEETVRSLIDVHGDLNKTAYVLLHDMIGPASQARLKAHLEKVDPELAFNAAYIPFYSQDEIDPAYALSLCTEHPDLLSPGWMAPVFAAYRFAPAGDSLVAAYKKAKQVRADNFTNRTLVRALCEIGDKRGLALAATDPFVAGAVKRYVPQVALADFPMGPLRYTRLLDGLRFGEWFEANESELQWNPKTAEFTVPSAQP